MLQYLLSTCENGSGIQHPVIVICKTCKGDLPWLWRLQHGWQVSNQFTKCSTVCIHSFIWFVCLQIPLQFVNDCRLIRHCLCAVYVCRQSFQIPFQCLVFPLMLTCLFQVSNTQFSQTFISILVPLFRFNKVWISNLLVSFDECLVQKYGISPCLKQ